MLLPGLELKFGRKMWPQHWSIYAFSSFPYFCLHFSVFFLLTSPDKFVFRLGDLLLIENIYGKVTSKKMSSRKVHYCLSLCTRPVLKFDCFLHENQDLMNLFCATLALYYKLACLGLGVLLYSRLSNFWLCQITNNIFLNCPLVSPGRQWWAQIINYIWILNEITQKYIFNCIHGFSSILIYWVTCFIEFFLASADIHIIYCLNLVNSIIIGYFFGSNFCVILPYANHFWPIYVYDNICLIWVFCDLIY